jgi:hypothetical protein
MYDNKFKREEIVKCELRHSIVLIIMEGGMIWMFYAWTKAVHYWVADDIGVDFF